MLDIQPRILRFGVLFYPTMQKRPPAWGHVRIPDRNNLFFGFCGLLLLFYGSGRLYPSFQDNTMFTSVDTGREPYSRSGSSCRSSRMKRSCLLLACVLAAATGPSALHAQETEPEPQGLTYVIRPAFTFLMSTVQLPEEEALHMTMYGQLRSQFCTDISSVHLRGYFNLDLMRQAFSNAPPVTMTDNLVITFIPSVIISDWTKLSLFLEMSMETQLTNTTRDGVPMRFLDPAFFYETAYVGQWFDWRAEENKHCLSVRYGIGYAFQQTVANQFLMTDERMMNLDPENPLSAVRQAPTVRLESGFSALAALEYNSQFSENLSAFTQAFGVALAKDLLGFTYRNSHAVLQIGAGINYRLFTLRYDLRVAYDPNYSLRRQLDQIATFGIQMEITN